MNLMDKVLNSSKMETNTKALSSMEKSKEKEFILILMGLFMREIGSMMSKLGKELFIIITKMCIEDKYLKERRMDMENMNIAMGIDTMETGRMTIEKDKGNCFWQMVLTILETF